MKIHQQIFLTSDTHFGHENLTKLFDRQVNFSRTIVDKWNEVVGKHDVVLHLGDLTMGNKEKTKELTSKLKGKKYLILGNHDKHSVSWYKDVGFTVIPNAFYMYSDKYDNWFNVLFTHIPVPDLPEHWLNIHGHLHGGTHRERPEAKNHIDVGVDVFDFTPIKLYKILDIWKEQK